MEASNTATDEALLSAYRDGRPDAFDLLIERYWKQVYAFLARFTGDAALAEDLTQEAFLQVHLSADRFDPAQKFRPWLFTIAANKARDRMRRSGRRPSVSLDTAISGEMNDGGTFADLVASAAPGPDEQFDEQETADRVRRVIETMPANFREVLLLSYFHEFSYRDMAEMIGVPVGTVKSRLHGAVAWFARRWRQEIEKSES
ncbi:MAG: ECF RNA polymerase sigma factor SigW [Phycisphaerae bacterium]|nr:ECF RNA polymerase sigma factor SigW [Phycisphaerae bacterium]